MLNDCVADTAMALVLNTLRKFPQSEAYLRAGYWATRGAYPLTTSLGGKTLGILGLGRIGEAIAKRAQAFGMKIRYHNRNKKDVPYAYDAGPVALAKNSDVLMVVTPGRRRDREAGRTRRCWTRSARRATSSTSRAARWSTSRCCCATCRRRRSPAPGSTCSTTSRSVPPEFFALDNAVLFPHVGSATVETRKAMGDLQIENLRLHFAGKPVKTPVV